MNEVSNWRSPCYTEDEGRSLGVALQEEASNHLKGLSLRAVVLSVQEKSGKRAGEYWKGDVQESHMRRRNLEDTVKTKSLSLSWEDCRANLSSVCKAVGVYVARVQYRLQCGT
jgi:hypothetical protein